TFTVSLSDSTSLESDFSLVMIEVASHSMSRYNIDTIQPFVFFTSDTLRNERISCNDRKLDKLDFRPWMETRKSDENFISSSFPIDNNGDTNKLFEQAKTLGVKKMK
ncbi:hypothetical protein PV326_001455, partial [Microctonus aethiopoides]